MLIELDWVNYGSKYALEKSRLSPVIIQMFTIICFDLIVSLRIDYACLFFHNWFACKQLISA